MTTATKDQVSERVVSALVEFGEEPENVKPDSRFEDLDIDSLDLVELAQVIEDEHGIEGTDAAMEQIANTPDARRRLAGPRRAGPGDRGRVRHRGDRRRHGQDRHRPGRGRLRGRAPAVMTRRV